MNESRALQIVQVMILEDVDRICKENDLTYYMIGGTLLGAVRHKGFIPWDDDIDLVMYREDYNKLIDIFKERFGQKYFVQNFYTDKEYTRYITKIRLNGTTLVEKNVALSRANQGIYIDIFPLDRVAKKDGLGLQLRGRLLSLLFSYKSVRFNSMVAKSKGRKLFGKLFRWVTFLFPQAFINKLFEWVCQKDNKKQCKYTTNFASHFKWKRQLFENEVYGKGKRLEFEGRYFNAPNEYEMILERLYGKNYMQLPPIEKRETHNIITLDLGEYMIKEND